MLIAHKVQLKPNNKQKTYFAKACGVARKAYNWALHEWQTQYKAWQEDQTLPKPNQLALRRQLNAIKREQFPYMLEVTKNAPQMAIIQLGLAFRNFFQGRAKYPTVRKKFRDDRFSLTNDQIKINNNKFRIPNLGWVRMHEELRFCGKIMSATVSRKAAIWFVSIVVETNIQHLPRTENQGSVGVDLGVSDLATLSTGEIIHGPKAYKDNLKRVKFLSKALSRKIKGSKNKDKARLKLAKLHLRIRNIRINALHELTTYLTKNFNLIGIEDLNVKGMVKNHCLARSICDMGFYEFRRQLEYKANIYDSKIVVAKTFFASSKLCSNINCDYKHENLTLSMRKWTCPQCLTLHDRELNAATNLKHMAVSSTVTACGGEGSGYTRLCTSETSLIEARN